MQDCQIQILRIVKKEWLSWQTFFLEYTMSAHVCFIHQWFKKQNADKIEIFSLKKSKQLALSKISTFLHESWMDLPQSQSTLFNRIFLPFSD